MSSRPPVALRRAAFFLNSVFLSSCATAALLAVPAPAFAQSAGSAATPADAGDLDTIVVSATLAPTPEREVASSVTVVTGEEIQQRQQRTLPDVLNLVPGVNVVQTGGPGGSTSIFMRGTNSNHTKVLVDGVDVGDPSSPNGAADISQLLTGDIARVEVLRGPQSGLYGSDAIGGVISITTQRGEGPPKITGYVEGGAFGTFNEAAGVSGSTDKTGYSFNVMHFSSNATQVTPQEIVPLGWPRNPNAYDNWTYSGRIDHTFSDAFSVNVVGRFFDTVLRYTQDSYPPPNYTALPEAFRSTSYSQSWLGKAEGIWTALDGNLVSTFGANATDISRPTYTPTTYNDAKYDGDRQTYYWRSLYTFLPGQTLLAGVERQNEGMSTWTAWGTDMTTSTGNSAAYTQLQTSFWDRLYVAANLRYDSNDDFGDHVTWRIAPALLIPETGTKLKANYGTGFKAPTLYQLYGPFGGNPDLQPEESEGWEAGFEQTLWKDRIAFGATYFSSDITNLIVSIWNPATFTSNNENISKAEIYGVEAFLALQVADNLRARLDYTYTHVMGYFPPGYSFGTGCAPHNAVSCYPMRRPSNKVSVTLDWQATEKLNLNASAVFLSGWWDVDRVTSVATPQEGYMLVNVAANYTLNQYATLFGRIDNLFDQTYEDPNGFLARGFGAYAGLRLTY